MSYRMGTGLLLCVALVAWSSWTTTARAQDEPDPGHTFQEATGIVWGLATFEILTTAGVVITEEAQLCGDTDCSGWIVLASMLTGIGVGIAAGLSDWPADAGFVAHTSFLGFGMGLGIGYGVGRAGGMDEDRARVPGALAGLGVALASGIYTTARRDAFVRDDDVAPASHLMSWGTMAAMSLTAVVGGLAGMDDGTLSWVMGAVGVALLGVSIAFAEIQRDPNEPDPTPAM